MTHRKLAGNLFHMQYHWKKRNSTADKQKHAFPAIQLKEAYLHTHTQKNTLLCDTKLKPALTRYKRIKTCF